MTPKNRPERPSAPNKPQPATRQEREAEALRANLKKRKQQTRARTMAEENKR